MTRATDQTLAIAIAHKAEREAQAAYLAIVDTGTRADIETAVKAHRATQAELSSAIAGNARGCPGCGKRPHGMLQQIAVGSEARHGFGIGCLSCPDRYSEGLSATEARERWSREEYHALRR